MAQDDEVQNAKGQEERLSEHVQDDKTGQQGWEDANGRIRTSLSFDPDHFLPEPPNNIPVGPPLHSPRAALDPGPSIASREGYIVTSAKVTKQPRSDRVAATFLAGHLGAP